MEEKPSEDTGAETRCGVFSWRPHLLQCFANIKAFTLTVSLCSIFGNVSQSYYTAVISQIEKQFGLSSTATGLLKNVDNLGFVLAILFVGHFCRYANKPRIFAFTTILIAGAVSLFALPYFIYGGSHNLDKMIGNKSLLGENKTSGGSEDLCYDMNDHNDNPQCHSQTSFVSGFNLGALAIFVTSQILVGIGKAPQSALSMTYIDDNAGKHTPTYFGNLVSIKSS